MLPISLRMWKVQEQTVLFPSIAAEKINAEGVTEAGGTAVCTDVTS